MGIPLKLQDASGVVAELPGIGILFAYGSATPTDSIAGYAPGCIFINHQGSADDQTFINEGTNTSTTWTAIGSVG